jgi:hypothetical protein
MTTSRRTAFQFRMFIVRPTLEYLGLAAAAAENLLVGTALYESSLEAFDQWTGPGDVTLGPAFGVYQIEVPTHEDVWANFLAFQLPLKQRVVDLLAASPDRDRQLATNLAYATAIARVIYYRVKDPLPAAADIAALGHYYKAHYNGPGKGDAEAWATLYRSLA